MCDPAARSPGPVPRLLGPSALPTHLGFPLPRAAVPCVEGVPLSRGHRLTAGDSRARDSLMGLFAWSLPGAPGLCHAVGTRALLSHSQEALEAPGLCRTEAAPGCEPVT